MVEKYVKHAHLNVRNIRGKFLGIKKKPQQVSQVQFSTFRRSLLLKKWYHKTHYSNRILLHVRRS